MSAAKVTLAAADAEDLEAISARLQDAVAHVKDLVYLPKSRRFAGLFNRFKWESAGKHGGARVRTGLHIDGVLSARATQLKRGNPDAVASLLAIRFLPGSGDDPGGTIELIFAGGGALRLEVECIAAELTDLSGEWAALGRPVHETES
jgi:hypothetical protein